MAIKFNTTQQSGEDYSLVPRKREIPQKWALFKSKCQIITSKFQINSGIISVVMEQVNTSLSGDK